MIKELVFLLEEESAKAMLQSLLPRFLDPSITTRFIAFDGKSDLQLQLVRRLQAYINPVARFIIMQDQDSAKNCKQLKAKLLQQCRQAGRESASLVRIACHELEAFYLGDLRAVEHALEVRGWRDISKR